MDINFIQETIDSLRTLTQQNGALTRQNSQLINEIAKESTINTKAEEIKQAVENIDLSSIENKMEEGVNNLSNKIDNIKLPEIDTTELAKQGENQEATNSAILSALNGVAASMYKGVPIVSQTGDATIAPNVLNVWGEVTSLNITKGNDIDGITNLYIIRFVAGENLQVSFTQFDLLWYGGSVPTWKAGSTYEINIVDNLALWAEFTPA